MRQITSVRSTNTARLLTFCSPNSATQAAALRFLKQALRRNGVPETLTIDGSDANAAASKSYNQEHGTAIALRQGKYLHKIVAQDHRAVKRVTRPMLGCKSFTVAQDTLVGTERMHMIKKRQLVVEEGDEGRTATELFYPRAASSPLQTWVPAPSRPPKQNLRHNHVISWRLSGTNE